MNKIQSGYGLCVSTSSINVDRIFQADFFDVVCTKLLKFHCHRAGKDLLRLDPTAKCYLMEYTSRIIKNLCELSPPSSIDEVIERIDYSFPLRLRPCDNFLEEVRLTLEKGKKKTRFLSVDKVFSCMRSVFPGMEPAVSGIFAHLIEHTLSLIIEWAVSYESKIPSGSIEVTDLQHISNLFGSPRLSRSSICQSLSLNIHRNPGDYFSHAKELQFFFQSIVEHLGLVIRVFVDPISDDLRQLSMAARSISYSGQSCEVSIVAANLLNVVENANAVFFWVRELYSNITLLSECLDDALESESRMLGPCLLEAAEDESFKGFLYYSEALFSGDCRNWTYFLSETPFLARSLTHSLQVILQTVVEKASSRRLTELQTRYTDPHTCNLCQQPSSAFESGLHGLSSIGGSASNLGESPRSNPTSSTSPLSIGGRWGSSWTTNDAHSSNPQAQASRYGNPNCGLLPQLINRPVRATTSHIGRGHSASRWRKKSFTSRRSISGSPSPPLFPRETDLSDRRQALPASNCLPISGSTTTTGCGATCRSVTTSLLPGGPGFCSCSLNSSCSHCCSASSPWSFCSSSSSSPSTTVTETSSDDGGSGGRHKGSQDSGSHSFDPRAVGSPSATLSSELQARLFEILPPGGGGSGNSASCSHMVIAYRYLLPRLLQLPILQHLYMTELIEALIANAFEENERVMLKDTLTLLSISRPSLHNFVSTQDWVKKMAPRLSNFIRVPLSSNVISSDIYTKLEDVLQVIRRSQSGTSRTFSAAEFIMDGAFQVRTEGIRSKRSDRVGYLFNSCLFLCKKQRRGLGTASNATSNTGWKLKKRIPLQQFHMIDLCNEVTDNNDTYFTFDLEYWEVPQRVACQGPPGVSTASSSAGVTGGRRSLLSGSSSPLSVDQQSLFTAVPSSVRPALVPTASAPGEGHSPPQDVGAAKPGPGSLAETLSRKSSALSLATLTSTSTLVSSVQSATTPAEPVVLTAGAAIAAASAAALDASSAAPRRRITFIFSSKEEKADWMAALSYLHLSRLFKRYVRELPRQEIPLVLPLPEVYRFSAPDSITNILFEQADHDTSTAIPMIRAATLDKLIERMTYHTYFDSKTINVFLITYRRYMRPLVLLDMLIDRFNVPEPDFSNMAETYLPTVGETDDPATMTLRLEKRFHSAYKRRVQYRVLNFITKWVKDPVFHKLDILNDQEFRNRLLEFLDSVEGRNVASNVTTIRKALRGDRIRMIQTFQEPAPQPLDFGLVTRPEDVKLTNVHPVELARQITLYEWELYSRIEFWEVNGKEKTMSPNLQASLKLSNKIKWWLVSSIMNAECLEDRLIVMQRVADLFILFELMDNLQGAAEAQAALLSPPVRRLYQTYEVLISRSKPHLQTVFESLKRPACQYEEDDTYTVDYEKRLHEVNPPGLPFIAVVDKRALIHLELKHNNWITVANSTTTSSSSPVTCSPGSPGASADSSTSSTVQLVNFWKCRQIADRVEYYLSFQQTPYNYAVDCIIRAFLETTDPLADAGVTDEHSFDDVMQAKSFYYQPKPPEEPPVISERKLSVLEQRLGAQLSLTTPDHKQTTDAKEFRSLMAIISSASCPSTTQTATVSPNAYGPNCPHASSRLSSQRDCTLPRHEVSHCCKRQLPPRGARSVSSSPTPPFHPPLMEATALTNTGPLPGRGFGNPPDRTHCVCCSPSSSHLTTFSVYQAAAAPPLPPRGHSRSHAAGAEAHTRMPEQFINQGTVGVTTAAGDEHTPPPSLSPIPCTMDLKRQAQCLQPISTSESVRILPRMPPRRRVGVGHPTCACGSNQTMDNLAQNHATPVPSGTAVFSASSSSSLTVDTHTQHYGSSNSADSPPSLPPRRTASQAHSTGRSQHYPPPRPPPPLPPKKQSGRTNLPLSRTPQPIHSSQCSDLTTNTWHR